MAVDIMLRCSIARRANPTGGILPVGKLPLATDGRARFWNLVKTGDCPSVLRPRAAVGYFRHSKRRRRIGRPVFPLWVYGSFAAISFATAVAVGRAASAGSPSSA